MKDMYYEEYDDQSTEDFDFIGVMGENPEPVVDIPSQVAELRRLPGRAVVIYVYKKEAECVAAM